MTVTSSGPDVQLDIESAVKRGVMRSVTTPREKCHVVGVGAAGNLGRHVVRDCLDRGCTVTASVHSPQAAVDAGLPTTAGVRVIVGDVTDSDFPCQNLVGADVVYYLVGSTSFWNPFNRRSSPKLLEYESFLPIAEWCRATDAHLVTVSSMYTTSWVSPFRWVLGMRYPRWVHWIRMRERHMLSTVPRCSSFRIAELSTSVKQDGVTLGIAMWHSRYAVHPKVLARVMFRAIADHRGTHGITIDVAGDPRSPRPTLQRLDEMLTLLTPG